MFLTFLSLSLIFCLLIRKEITFESFAKSALKNHTENKYFDVSEKQKSKNRTLKSFSTVKKVLIYKKNRLTSTVFLCVSKYKKTNIEY